MMFQSKASVLTEVDNMRDILQYSQKYGADKEYSFLVKNRKRDIDGRITVGVEDVFTQDELANRVVVRDCSRNKYYVFPTHEATMAFIGDLHPEQRTFHEMIFGYQNQKLKVDIDLKDDDIQKFEPLPVEPPLTTWINDIENNLEDTVIDTKTKAENILETFISGINETMFMLYMKNNVPLIVTDNSGPTETGYKYSYHIIIDGYYVRDHIQADLFIQELSKSLPIRYKPFLDNGVNKTKQGLRLLHCRKTGSVRVKTLKSVVDTEGNLIEEVRSMVTYVEGCEELEPIKEVQYKNTNDTMVIDDKLTKEVLAISKDVTYGFELRSVLNNIFVFNRKFPTYCLLCDEIHHTDNTFMLQLNQNAVFALCRHKKGESEFIGNVGEEAFKLPEVVRSSWGQKKIQKALDRVDLENPNNPTLFDNLPAEQLTVYSEPSVRAFENNDTLVVKAGMKMGKSKKLKEYIENNFTSKLVDPKIIILAFRQTWSTSVKESFPNFTLYSDVKGTMRQNKIIIQIESLHRLQIHGMDVPDCLVLDECESIFEQFDSGNIANFNAAFATFQYILRYSKKVVLMDAHLSDRTYRMIERFRGLNTVHYHYNQYKNAVKDNYYFTSHHTHWLNQLIDAIEDDKKICIPISSLGEAEAINEHLKSKFPHKQIKLYSSKTAAVEKKEHFSAVNVYWKEFDVLIYTPTVSAGISFEQEHYDQVFGYFTDKSCNVETCIQMIGRIRNVKDSRFVMCFKLSYNNLPTQHNDIEAALVVTRENLLKRTTTSLLNFEYGPLGEIKYNKNDYYYLWLENTITRNLSCNYFESRFINYVADVGAQCHLLEYIEGEVDDTIQEQHNGFKQQIANEQITAIVDSNELTDDAVAELQGKFKRNEVLTTDEDASYKKYNLRRAFNWEGNIDTKFVKTYNSKRCKDIYRNLLIINKFDSITDSLNDLHENEVAYLSMLNMTHGIFTDSDIHHKYQYDKHRIACGLLKACGLDTVKVSDWIPVVVLEQRLRNAEKEIYNSLPIIQQEFGKIISVRQLKNQDRMQFVANMIKFINGVISQQYGVRFNSSDDNTLYRLMESKLFTTDETITDRPFIGDTPDMIYEDDEEYV